MAELGLRWEFALRDEADHLHGLSVKELKDKFNEQMGQEDFVPARHVIDALFKVDCYDDNSTRESEAQRTDLICQCLDSYTLRLFASQHTAMIRACDALGMRDLFRVLPTPPADEAATGVLRSSLSKAVREQEAVNVMCKRHSASQRFRRTWLHDEHRQHTARTSRAASNRALQRFEKTLLQCFIVGIQLHLVEAWFALGDAASDGDEQPEEMTSEDWQERFCSRHLGLATENFKGLEAAISSLKTPWEEIVAHPYLHTWYQDVFSNFRILSDHVACTAAVTAARKNLVTAATQAANDAVAARNSAGGARRSRQEGEKTQEEEEEDTGAG